MRLRKYKKNKLVLTWEEVGLAVMSEYEDDFMDAGFDSGYMWLQPVRDGVEVTQRAVRKK